MVRQHSDAERGLSAAEVSSRLQHYGPNQLREAPGASALVRLGRQFNDLRIWLLLAATVISGLLGEWIDTAAIVAIVLLNAVLGLVEERWAEQALAA